jgi:hypothetical protein
MRIMIARVLRAAADRLAPTPPPADPPRPVWPVTWTAPGWPMGATTTTVAQPTIWTWNTGA